MEEMNVDTKEGFIAAKDLALNSLIYYARLDLAKKKTETITIFTFLCKCSNFSRKIVLLNSIEEYLRIHVASYGR